MKQNGPRPPRSLAVRWFPKWIFPVLLILSIVTVALRLKIVNTVYEINQTEKIITNSKRAKEKAAIKIAALRSPRRLEILSKIRFKLVQPEAKQVVYLK
jgi:hypothetical protein